MPETHEAILATTVEQCNSTYMAEWLNLVLRPMGLLLLMILERWSFEKASLETLECTGFIDLVDVIGGLYFNCKSCKSLVICILIMAIKYL